MYKIKIVGILIFTLSLFLVFLSKYIATENKMNMRVLTTINEQKSSIQEISKSILYLYKNRGSKSKQLDRNIKTFLDNMEKKEEPLYQNSNISKLWNNFYKTVQKFKEQQKVITAYSSILTQKLVNDIYHKNIKLINALNIFMDTQQSDYQESMEQYKNIQYALFLILLLLLTYLFTRIREIISFIQKFSITSKAIIQSASIKGLEPIEVQKSDEAVKEATQNFNHFVQKINKSIVYANRSIEHTTDALEELEENIEDFISLLSQMQEKQGDNLSQKEDAVIDSLEIVMQLTQRLKNLHKDLDNLT